MRGALMAASLALVILTLRLPPTPVPTIQVLYVASTDAFDEDDGEEQILEPLIAEFNRTETMTSGKVIRVEGRGIASGEAESMIAAQELKPIAWTPASSLWGRILNRHVNAPWVDEAYTILESPQVLAFWEEHAEILHRHTESVGWNDVLSLARKGWADYGRPDLGDLLLGHTHPEVSTSGLSAVLSMYYAFSGKTTDLRTQDIKDPEISEKVRAIQLAVVHYGRTVDHFLEQLRRHGKGFAHAVYMQETSLVQFNQNPPKAGRLVGIYPEEGTFVADYHLYVLDAPWVTEEQSQAADVFARWLVDRIDDPRMAAGYGFRVPGFNAEPPIDQNHGANPEPPQTRMLPPDGEVITDAQEDWRENRKLANIMLVVDTSASMGRDQKLERVRDALPGCLEELVPADRIGLTTFDDHVRKRVALNEWQQNEPELSLVISQLLPGGPESRLYDAIARAYRGIRLLADLEGRINAVVVLTDGRDVGSLTAKEELLALLEGQDPLEGGLVRVFTVAYGPSVDKQSLQDIADASQGLAFEGDQTEIPRVCRTVFFSF
jgi:Ca-activated chloride channel family protein